MNKLPHFPVDLDFDQLAKATTPAFANKLETFLKELAEYTDSNFTGIDGTAVRKNEVPQVPEATVAQLNASNPKYKPFPNGRIVKVTNDIGGRCIAVSDGGKWYKLTLGAQIS